MNGIDNPRNAPLTKEIVTSILNACRSDCDRKPNDLSLYQTAFVHRSYVQKTRSESFERLEYLGDSVLNAGVANYLFQRFPEENEGFLTRLRSKLVNGIMLSLLSERLGLSRYVLLSSQAEQQGLRTNARVSEDIFEAFLGAMFLDLGFDASYQWLVGLIERYIDFGSLVMTM